MQEKYHISDAEINEKIGECELLNNKRKKIFREVLKRYSSILAKKSCCISMYELVLKISDDKPFIVETYSIPMRLRELVTSDINNFTKLVIIRRSNNPYINLLVTSLKKWIHKDMPGYSQTK